VFVAGGFQNYLTVAPLDPIHSALAGNHDAFVARIGADGNGQWAKAITGGATERIFGLTTDTDGAVWAVGDFDGSLQVDGCTIQGAPVGGGDVFVVKLAP